MLAAKHGHAAVVSALLTAGAEVDKTTVTGETALMIAAHEGSSAAVSVLLTAGAEVDKARADGVTTALRFATQRGHAAVVSLLLTAGAAVDKGQSTALMIAAHEGHAGTVSALLTAGAEVDKTMANGQTALMIAAKNGHAAVVSLLLTAGAEVDKAKAAGGWTALLLAARYGHLEVMRTLLAAGATDSVRADGATLLSEAAFRGHPTLVPLLLEAIERRRSNMPPAGYVTGQCVVCHDDEAILLVLHPCMHQIMCGRCYAHLVRMNKRTCPLCRQSVDKLTMRAAAGGRVFQGGRAPACACRRRIKAR
jgi:ankyrin repeat protein